MGCLLWVRSIRVWSVCYTRHRHSIAWWRHQIETFPRYWPFVRGIHRSPVNSPHKGQWRGTLMYSLLPNKTNGWVNDRDAADLWRHCAHYDVTVMYRDQSVYARCHWETTLQRHFLLHLGAYTKWALSWVTSCSNGSCYKELRLHTIICTAARKTNIHKTTSISLIVTVHSRYSLAYFIMAFNRNNSFPKWFQSARYFQCLSLVLETRN